MNGLSVSELCCLFCCPPCPGRIAAKLAFLPPDPTYSLVPEPEPGPGGAGAAPSGPLRTSAATPGRWKIHLTERADFQYGQRELDTIEVFVTKSARANRIACMYVRCVPGARYGISPDSIILYGQSIGTVPTVDLASRYECAAVVLHSPLTSGMRVAFPDTKKTYCFDAFPNIEKVSKITSPVLIIHGTEDEVIDFSHGLALYERCPKAVEPLWVEGAGHNDIELYSQYLERLRRFISQELPSQRA
ncbi:alpha/beta hydrolase domain-containing protein 17A isoform X2 [Mus musculus]|uniref:alpha/beta hydrolase domain-containing protein 17A isoform X2 n=1 Tax=Mus musculus TaxID=10090 RepID=UPI0000353F4D|nr:alpha/beta hydrolase domain-containing protein 17A isoform X2 [Mus musculus]XP_030100883.1 alpha/beta hydrolase domain-containing protein 17A isoform X2 [Mus musculus]|eukprot:XP_006513567.1 PREDICTED: protein ABHD17A isoform X2 [Mus musculus]